MDFCKDLSALQRKQNHRKECQKFSGLEVVVIQYLLVKELILK
jgi:hypothetical protein